MQSVRSEISHFCQGIESLLEFHLGLIGRDEAAIYGAVAPAVPVGPVHRHPYKGEALNTVHVADHDIAFIKAAKVSDGPYRSEMHSCSNSVLHDRSLPDFIGTFQY